MSSAHTRPKRRKKSAKSPTRGERIAFIAAPPGTDTSVIRQLLQKHGTNAFALDEMDLPGASLSRLVREAIDRADVVIAVLAGREESRNVLIEVGVAQGLKKPTLIIAADEEATSLGAETGIPYLRAKPNNFAALDFGLAQFLAAPHHHNSALATQKETQPLGDGADALLARLRRIKPQPGSKDNERLLQDIVVEALKASGISTLSVGQRQGDARSIDIAVWCNDLEPWIQNPFLIEVKGNLPGQGELDALVKRFSDAFGPGIISWALVIYGEAAPQAHRLKHLHPHILLISAEDFLVSLRDTAFGDLIRKLQSERLDGRG